MAARDDDLQVRPGRISHGNKGARKTKSFVGQVMLAAKKAGHDVKVPFTPGRMDASQDQTDVDSFAPLEPAAAGPTTECVATPACSPTC